VNVNEPVTTIRRVPRCSRCGAHEEPHADGARSNLILHDGPIICRDCVTLLVRLSGVQRPAA